MEDATSDFSFQVGAATGTQNQILVDIKSMNTIGLGLDGGANGVTGEPAVEAGDAYDALDETAFSNAGDIAARTNLLNAADSHDHVMANITADTAVTITVGNNVTTTVTLLAANSDKQNAALITGIAGITAAGAKANNASTHADGAGIALTFADVAAVTASAAVTALDAGNNISVEDTSSGSDDADDNALASIVLIDAAIKKVNVQRSELGAVSNRLNHTVNNLTNISSNLTAAKGGIEDTDFAVETTNLAKHQILQQASTAMLAQANASKQNVLALLRS